MQIVRSLIESVWTRRIDRYSELRTEETATLAEAGADAPSRRKIEMFNSGEIEVMFEAGLAPLLYGETLIGDNVPNLTYILSAPNMEAHGEHWKAFGAHPKWQRMRAMEKYKGTVSGIDNYFLEPTDFSQI